MVGSAVSAGLLMYSFNNRDLKVFLVHPGGPYFINKDNGYWGIPKGLQESNEDLMETAIREFREETGVNPSGDYLPLGSIKQKNGKVVHAWAFRTEKTEPVEFQSNKFEIEWPPNSGRKQSFPEVDKCGFFSPDIARIKIVQAQIGFITELEKLLNI